ncbi:MAG: prefoldin subunit alpha [Nanoarchaeota archaeon]|nr:prefoldin subunit alpha [Nanoarchaeota archaeon]
MDQELILKAGLLHRHFNEIEEKLNFIEQQVFELQNFDIGLDELDKSKESGMLAPLGKGIFIESEIKDKKLFVEVGAGILIRKSPEEARKIIVQQINKLKEIKHNLSDNLTSVKKGLGDLMKEVKRAES